MLNKLAVSDKVQANVAHQERPIRAHSLMWFAEVVRIELGKVLGIMRNKAIAKARTVPVLIHGCTPTHDRKTAAHWHRHIKPKDYTRQGEQTNVNTAPDR